MTKSLLRFRGPGFGPPRPASTDLDTTAPGTDDPFESISSFFDSGLWSAITVVFQVFVVALWLALAYWTWQDARRRIAQPALVAGAVALSVLLPFLGSIIYLVIRPPEYLDDARERELELLALERRLGDLGDQEGQAMVSRLIAREVGGSEAGVRAALKEAGAASKDDLRDLDLRLTELEFRLRLLDRTSLPTTPGGVVDQEREPELAGRIDLDRLDEEAAVRARRARPARQGSRRRLPDDG